MSFTTLIPVYKTHFLEDTITCLNAQTLPSTQVIFSDDSPAQDVQEILDEIQSTQAFRFPFQVLKGRRIGPVTNCHDLLAAWAAHRPTPYIHFLLDDDLIFPDFYLWHARALEKTNAKLCISSRITVRQEKTPFSCGQNPSFISNQDRAIVSLNIIDCAQPILHTLESWLGELSFATFNGASLQKTVKGKVHRLPYYGLNDLGLFFEMMLEHPACYINNNLGAFRLNPWQTSRDSHSIIFQSTVISWAALLFDMHEIGYLQETDLRQGLVKIGGSIKMLPSSNLGAHSLSKTLDNLEDIKQARQLFEIEWINLLSGNPDYSFNAKR